jgi:lipid II:glycine glycyltransferase (peptidoglycan interpeptide bridge formation enzyme)
MRLQKIVGAEEISEVFNLADNGNFQQDFAWGEFQKSIGRESFRYMVLNDNGEPVLYVQLMAQSIAGKKYFYAPFGPVFSNILDLKEKRQVFNYFAVEFKKEQPKALFLRVETQENISDDERLSLLSNSHFKKTVDLSPHKTLILGLEKTNSEILAGMKPKTRYNIKVAEKSGIEVKILNEVPVDSDDLNPFDASADRAKVKTYTKEYFDSMLKYFSDPKGKIVARCYAAYHEGDLLAANIMIEYGAYSIYLFGGAFELKRAFMPSYALHWQAILDAKEHHLKFYDFWGVETDEHHPWYGFSRFKFGFGGEIKERPGTLDYVYSSSWYNAYILLRKLNRFIRRR